MSSALFGDNWSPEFNAEAALQGADAATVQKFDVWNSRTVDLPGAYFAQTAEWIFRENRLANGSFPALGREVGLAEIAAPIFALAASDDAVVSLPQVTAIKSKCRRASVAIRVEPGRHLSLFMGRRTLRTAWRDIARWLGEEGAARASAAKRSGGMKEHGVNPDRPRTLIRGKRPI
jgi:poly(3-hydroxyalkanoate) synthetase